MRKQHRKRKKLFSSIQQRWLSQAEAQPPTHLTFVLRTQTRKEINGRSHRGKVEGEGFVFRF